MVWWYHTYCTTAYHYHTAIPPNGNLSDHDTDRLTNIAVALSSPMSHTTNTTHGSPPLVRQTQGKAFELRRMFRVSCVREASFVRGGLGVFE